MKPDRLVLAYHAVSDRWRSSLAVSPAALREQVSHLLDRGYRPVRFIDTVLRDAREPLLAVTFDDAYVSVFERALPVLAELGAPATVFVPTRFAGGDEPMSWPGIERWAEGEHADELRCISWGQAAALSEAGWEVGSHSRSHARLTLLDQDSLEYELRASKTECERALGARCRSIAYPYGDFSTRVGAAAAAAGYEAGAAMPGRGQRDGPMARPRVAVYPADDMRRFRLKVDRRLRALRETRALELAARLRRSPRS